MLEKFKRLRYNYCKTILTNFGLFQRKFLKELNFKTFRWQYCENFGEFLRNYGGISAKKFRIFKKYFAEISENQGKFWKKISEIFRRKFENNKSPKIAGNWISFMDLKLSLLQFYGVHKQRHCYNKYLFKIFSFSR